MPGPAVLLLAFGGPETLDDVAPFMERLMGRVPPPAAVQSASAKYELIGGGSPLPEMVGHQAHALRAALDGVADVFVGMRYSAPTIEEVVARITHAGHAPIVALSLSPQYSAVSTGAYEQALEAACDAAGYEGDVHFVESWHDEPGFLDALADRVIHERLDPAVEAWPVILTAHSLPETDAGLERYVTEVSETVSGVVTRACLDVWRMAYQSRGRAECNWLGPAIEEVMEDVALGGAGGVVVAPVGFVTEHMETRYDLDIVARRQADELGLGFARVPTLGTHPVFIEALAGIVRAHLED
jgi:protoporphyrin/coproporphyrin ferrochelatase